jgi:collagenase-like PrtC family protease
MQNGQYEVEVNDITAMAYLNNNQAFRIGSYANVYNESTLRYLAALGANSICLPPELPITTVEILAARARALHVGCEVWASGRILLAISNRCYHAQIDGLTKNLCQFICARGSDGLDISTADGKKFLTLNGVQTMSHAYCNLIGDIARLAATKVTALRLSPHGCDMVVVAQAFRDRLDGRYDSADAVRDACSDASFSNGFLLGKAGAEMAHGLQPR